MSARAVAVRRLGRSEPGLLRLAHVHRNAIPQGFLSTLSDTVLVRLYAALAAGPTSFVFVVESGTELAGFIVGSTDTQATYRRVLLSEALQLVFPLARSLMSVARIRRAMETLAYSSRMKRKTSLPSAEILNFCVNDKDRRSGIGSALFEALVREFRARGVSAIRIVTGSGQTEAHAFYRRRGAVEVDSMQVHQVADSLVFRLERG